MSSAATSTFPGPRVTWIVVAAAVVAVESPLVPVRAVDVGAFCSTARDSLDI